ncbi:hypothetical protein ACQBAU_05570 [Propionibacteriaceae bacterium Y2011]
MQYYQTDHSSGARLIGGEMMSSPDAGQVGDLGVLPDQLAPLVRGCRGRVLLAGPRAAMFVDLLDDTVGVDVVVRGLAHAQEISADISHRAGAVVWCGGLERLVEPGPYDLVIMLDGPERVLTPDSPGMDHAGLVKLVAGWLAEDGVVVAQVANGMSIADLLELPMEPRDVDVEVGVYDPLAPVTNPDPDDEGPQRDRFVGRNANEQWWRGATGFADRAPHLGEVSELFSSQGLQVAELSAAYPEFDHPSVVVSAQLLDDPQMSQVARSRAVAAQVESYSARAALLDPGNSVDRLFEAGLAQELAPSWLVVAHRGAAPLPIGDRPDALYFRDHQGTPVWRTVWHVDGSTEDTDQLIMVPTARREVNEGRLARNIEPQPIAVGLSLESVLREALASGNHARIRRVIRSYAGWLLDDTADLGKAVGSAMPDNVTVQSDGGLALSDATWRWYGPASPALVLARGLRRASMRLLRAGLPHPWRTDISPDELTTTLLIMAGVEDTEHLVAQAATVEADWWCILQEVPSGRRDEVVAEQVAAGESQFTAMPAPARGYRESVQKASRMATELEVRQGQVMWLEAALRTREQRMAAVERNLGDIRRSASFRVGRALTWPGRQMAQGVRRTAMRMVPPGMLDKMRKLMR